MLQQKVRRHPLDVPSYEGSLQLLAERIHRMRYDKVSEFYCYCATELHKQAESDAKKGRKRLAALLTQAASTTQAQADQFQKIFDLCKPHMNEEELS